MTVPQKRMCLNLVTITSIIVPGSNKQFNFFQSAEDIVIPWDNIRCIGEDIILVEL